jgi:hypothetical protein
MTLQSTQPIPQSKQRGGNIYLYKKEDVEKYFKKEAHAKKNLLYSTREEKTFAEILKKVKLA